MINLLDVNVCQQIYPVIAILKNGVIPIFQIGIPILLIVFGMIDLGKAVIASKEDEIKKAQGMLIKRAIYAVVCFLLVTIVTVLTSVLAGSNTGKEEINASTNWLNCWNYKPE